MIYLIQPFLYKQQVAKKIKKIIAEKYPDKKLKICHTYHNNSSKITRHIYFIINDTRLRTWDGIQISKNIRNNETNAILILISNELDYQKFFRSHVGFFGIIDLDNLEEIEDYLQDSIRIQKTAR